MKKPVIIAAIAIAAAVIMCISLFGSNNDKPNGTYSATVGGKVFATLTFSGDKFTYEGSTKTLKGNFTMDGDTVTLEYENGNTDKLVYDPEADTLNLSGLVFQK